MNLARFALIVVVTMLTFSSGLSRGENVASQSPAEEAGRPSSPQTQITIHADQAGIRVSPNLYGAFFEEINHAGEGGLYAELVKNRAFKEMSAHGPTGWELQVAAGAKATAAVDESVPLNAANAKAMKIDVEAMGDAGTVSLLNTGYWGIHVAKGARYRFSMYARRTRGEALPIVVSLRGKDGVTLAQTTINGVGPDWKKFSAELVSLGDDPAAKLSINIPSTGTIYVNIVSLFPADTFKGRENGMRKDLAEMVAALHPAFLRFPGGCYVEGGDYLANRYQWKKTIGDISQRPGHANAVWRYWSTDGLGYHEYLQFCQDIGAEPLYVFNCGMSHKESLPIPDLQPYVQDALDAIEYANGPVTSKWGAERAKNGHPEPFNLKMVEIGNENGMGWTFGGDRAHYEERYQIFYNAVKTKYPGIQTIANTRITSPMDFVDDHFYQSPGWFWSDLKRYDKAERGKKPLIYVGEYADTIDCGIGNLRAAVAEAAWMTMLERNSDVVAMASYAPMFVQTNDRRWNPDAIVFDSASAYGTPSYWVQKMFADARADVMIPTDVATVSTEKPHGGIGVGTWNTQAEFKDVKVTRGNNVLYASNFASGDNDWRALEGGKWDVSGAAYRQTAAGENHCALLNSTTLAAAGDYTLELKARKTGGAEGFLILFHAQSPNDFCWWNVGGWGNSQMAVEKATQGAKIILGEKVPGKIETGKWYDVKIDLKGSVIRCYLDGKLAQEVKDEPAVRFTAIAGKCDKDGAIIVKAVNGAADSTPATLKFDGVNFAGPAEVTTLTSASDGDENTFQAPLKISPVSTQVIMTGPTLNYIFPPQSVVTLKLKTR